MKDEIVIELNNANEIAKDVAKVIKKAGVYGLSQEKAKELGFFDRIANLLALLAVTTNATDRVFGMLDHMLTDYGVKKHEIKRNCTAISQAYNKFLSTWEVNNYFAPDAKKDFNADTEELYHLLMRWAKLPEVWDLGDKQKVESDDGVLFRIELDDRYLNMYSAIISSEQLEEPVEEWCVTKYDHRTKKQHTVHTGMTKADAQMVAKRLSAEDAEGIYTASILRASVVKNIEVVPMKAYRGNELVGDVRKVLKKKDNGGQL